MALASEHLGSQISVASAEGQRSLVTALDAFTAQSKVCDLCVPFAIDNYIFGLQISEYDVLLMQSFDSQQNLPYVNNSLGFFEGGLNLYVLREITTWAVITYKEEAVFSLKCVPQLYNKRMFFHLLHYISFGKSVLLQTLLSYLLLFQYFHRK